MHKSFFTKNQKFGWTSEEAVLCTIHVVGLYPKVFRCKDGEKSDNWDFIITCRNCFKDQHLPVQ